MKNAPAYWQAGICPAFRGIDLILALLDEFSETFEARNNSGFLETKPVCFLSNRASHCDMHWCRERF
jgi:hypothetical protein